MTLLVVVSLLALQDDPAALIEKLRSENLEIREAATKKLKELGTAARPALEKAAKDADVEVSTRSAYLLRILKLKEDLPPNLQKAIPDVADRLARGAGQEWTAVFLEAVAVDEKVHRKLPSVTREDLIPLVSNAIRGAVANEDKIRACWMASNWRLKSALPEMLKLLGDGDPHVRQMALVWCVVLGGREVAGPAADLLKDGNLMIREHAANHLVFVGTKAQSEALRAALKDPEERVRLNAARALGKLGDRAAADSIALLLETNLRADAAVALGDLGRKEYADKIVALLKEPGTRWHALVALELLDARERAESIAKYLEDAGPGTPGHAAMVLGNWKCRGYTDRIAAMVKGKVAGDYNLAVMALGRMGDPGQSKTLVPVLTDGSNYMRADAAEALELLDARECVGDIAALLKDSDNYARWKGALVVGKLAARLQAADRKTWIDALKPLEKDASEEVRFAAAISVFRLGAASQAETLEWIRRLNSTWFESWLQVAAEWVLALTQVHEAGGFDKLMREVELKRAIESPGDLSAALSDSGLKLLNGDDLTLNGRMSAGRIIRPLNLLESLVVPAWGLIVEKDSLRLVTRPAALEHWIQRLQGK